MNKSVQSVAVLRKTCILVDSALQFFLSICPLFFSIRDRPICISLSMYILPDLEDATDLEEQSVTFRLDIESAGYISDVGQALYD